MQDKSRESASAFAIGGACIASTRERSTPKVAGGGTSVRSRPEAPRRSTSGRFSSSSTDSDIKRPRDDLEPRSGSAIRCRWRRCGWLWLRREGSRWGRLWRYRLRRRPRPWFWRMVRTIATARKCGNQHHRLKSEVLQNVGHPRNCTQPRCDFLMRGSTCRVLSKWCCNRFRRRRTSPSAVSI